MSQYPHDTLPGVSTWSFRLGPNALQSEDEQQAHVARRKSSRFEVRTGDATWNFLEGENEEFQAWYADDLDDGAKRFYVRLPAEHVSGFLWHVARFVRKRVVSKGYGYHEVTATLEAYAIAGEPPDVIVAEVDVSAVTNSGADSLNGVAVAGLDPEAVYRVERPAGKLYTGYSAWPSDESELPPSVPNDQKWGNALVITKYPGDAVDIAHDRSLATQEDRGYANGPLARAAWQPVYVSGSAEYRFWIADPAPSDNRGGASLRLIRTTPPPPNRSSAYRDAVLASSPIGYWLLNETSGGTAAAEVGTDGVLLLGSLDHAGMLDRTRGCFKGDGVAGRIQVPDASLDLQANFSVECVIKKSSDNGALFSTGPGGWHLRTVAGRGVEFLRSQVASIATATNILPPAGIPFHFGFTLTAGSPKTWRMFVNGAQVATGTTSSIFAGAGFFRIGCDTLAAGLADVAFTTHFLQDVAFYASVLPQASFLSHAQAGGLA